MYSEFWVIALPMVNIMLFQYLILCLNMHVRSHYSYTCNLFSGHGTYLDSENGRIMASVAGRVERVNKLICVKPLKTRLNTEVFQSFWLEKNEFVQDVPSV